MQSTEFRKGLNELGISPYRFAQIARIDKSTVYKWLRENGIVPGYAVTILELIQQERRLRAQIEQEIRAFIDEYDIGANQWT